MQGALRLAMTHRGIMSHDLTALLLPRLFERMVQTTYLAYLPAKKFIYKRTILQHAGLFRHGFFGMFKDNVQETHETHAVLG